MLHRMLVISLAVVLVASVGAAGENPWFDMENCAMCKGMTSNPELMKNMTWEQHNISNGVLSVTNVSDKYLDAYRAAHAEMEKVGMRLGKGEMLELCGSCVAFGKCMTQGITQEYVETSTGDVWLAMSDKPEVVAELQNWAKRNKEEMAKMKKTKKIKKEKM